MEYIAGPIEVYCQADGVFGQDSPRLLSKDLRLSPRGSAGHERINRLPYWFLRDDIRIANSIVYV